MTPKRTVTISLILSVILGGLKFIAYIITGSVAVLSDAMESIVNIVSAGIAFLGLWISEKPPDSKHPYGHTKIEYTVSLLEGILIIIAAIFLAKETVERFILGKTVEHILEGSLILSLTIIINSTLATTLIINGKKENSMLLLSHGYHIISDVVTTVGAVIGISLSKVTGYAFFDPLVATIICIKIVHTGFKIIRSSTSCLMDENLERDKLESIREIVNKTLEESEADTSLFSMHNVKSRKAGKLSYVDFHLSVPRDMTVKEAHDLCERIEKNIKKSHPNTNVMIHIDPDNEKD